jgi:hypothetical protein
MRMATRLVWGAKFWLGGARESSRLAVVVLMAVRCSAVTVLTYPNAIGRVGQTSTVPYLPKC